MKVVFLDIDGVLNSYKTTTKTPGGFVGISDSLSKRLKSIIHSAESEDNEIKVVLTSSWKYMNPSDDDYKYMMSKLSRADAVPIGITKEPDDNSELRGEGIRDFLDSHKDISYFVILDDYLFDMVDELSTHLVLTDEKVGLTDADVAVAIDILSGNLLPEGYYSKVDKERGYYR